MATSSGDSPASLYGPVSIGLGVGSVVAVGLSGSIGIAVPLLAGILAVVFGTLGLVSKTKRGQCVVGVVGGAIGVLYPVFLIAAVSV